MSQKAASAVLLPKRWLMPGIGKRLIRLGLKDTYAHGGSRPYLMRYYGLDATALIKGIEDLMRQDFGISEQDLDTARVDDVHSLAKAEAL